MITLDNGVDPIVNLPNSLEWVDEYEWFPVSQDIQDTIGGGLVISEALLLSGRPITLVGGDSVWVDKTVIDSLVAFANGVGKTYTLTLPDARTFQVAFKRDSGAPVEPKQVYRKNVPGSTDKYTLTLRLMEI